jgi:Right handed beta helix region
MYRANRKRSLLFSALSLAAALLFAVGSASAQEPVSTCGRTLTKAGTYFLTTDLDCSGTLASGVTITASHVTFHLAGHTISSTDCSNTKEVYGIFAVPGITAVKIDGGNVKGFSDGIVLYSSHSRARGMTVTGACLFGIAVSGQSNQVDTSTVTLSPDGIGIGAASGTHIVSNNISGNLRVGVDISNSATKTLVLNNIINNNGLVSGQQGGVVIFSGTDNLIANNALNDNFEGIGVEWPGNMVRDNVVTRSVHTGIFISTNGSPSTVANNVVLGSGLADMDDDSPGCALNTWKKNNIFQTDLVAGASDGGRGVGCI